MPRLTMRRIGGIRFIRVGRLQVTLCRVRPRVTTYHCAGHVLRHAQ